MTSNFTEAEKAAIRRMCEDEIASRERSVAASIELVGGEENLLMRIDHLIWVYNDRAEIEKYREALRFIDGDENVDWEKISWVLKSFRQREYFCRSRAEDTRRIIEENVYNKERLQKEIRAAKGAKTSVDALAREKNRMLDVQ